MGSHRRKSPLGLASKSRRRVGAAAPKQPSRVRRAKAGQPAKGQLRPGGRSVFPVVGVGASAGGLEAFRQLLAALPDNTGMAYVLVQHLDPRHESFLTELLAKGSRLPVSEVKETVAVEPDHVYVTPGQQDLTIEDGLLKLIPRSSTRGQHMPIDAFLSVLAGAHGSKAIGVILSGTGSDGTLGVAAIKKHGGIAFAQTPGSAAYDGMPRSAIASGCVDFTLSPAQIAEELSRLGRHPYVTAPARDVSASEPPAEAAGKDSLQPILAVLRETCGSDFRGYKPATIRRRIARRMALVHVETLADYERYLLGHRDEVQALQEDCLISVTSFFRDSGAFKALCGEIVPRMLQRRPADAPIRAWVPGCATGEEVYSIAICLLESEEERYRGGLQIFATDLSERAIEKARAGRYPANIAQDVSPERLRRFFTEADDGYRVSKAVRDLCTFARHDLTKDPPFSRLDLVSCRNMLIYFEPYLQQRVLATFHYALQPWGVLQLGASEAPGAAADLFAPLDKKHRIYSKRPTATPAGWGFSAPRVFGRRPEAAPEKARPALREDLQADVDRLLLARYAPAAVVVDGKDVIVEFRGQTDAYLQHTHGQASLSVLKMARQGLLLELRRAVREAREKDAPSRAEAIEIRQRGKLHRLDLEVIPLERSPEKERSLLVLFEARPEERVRRAGPAGRPRDSATASSRDSARLRRELTEVTRYLQTVLQEHEAASQELQTSNEEVLSANEELQSINEELETAKEELQSTNEELSTLNRELQDRNRQLGRALAYVSGIVETVRNPLLTLDGNLRVERANRAFYEFFGVTAEETLGRFVYELGDGQWSSPELHHALDEVLPKDARIEGLEVEHDFPGIGNRTLLLNARRLHEEGDDQDNILLAFEDVTDARKTEQERQKLLGLEHEARQRAEHADRVKDEFVATVSHELRGPLNAVVGWVHILRAGGLDEATSERGLQAIERGVHSQVRLVEELLDYSRMLAGKLSLSPRLMNLVPVAEAAMLAVGAAADAKAIQLHLATIARSAMVHGDADRLQQVLWNLLSNAVKFTPRGGRVDVWIGRVGTDLHVRVSDTGQGISPDFLPNVFVRFRQEERAPRRRQGGLGLGLAIVKELVEMHGGTVAADSPGEGRGATFTVALPVPPLLVEPSGGEDEPGTESTGGGIGWERDRTVLAGLRLLVVEDDRDSREMLVTLFERCGATVRAAGSVAEAEQALKREAPDVLVCDIGLPGEDGHELIRRIRSREAATGSRLPGLALTAYAAAEDRQSAIAAGFDLHVAKPAAPAELVTKVVLLARSSGGG